MVNFWKNFWKKFIDNKKYDIEYTTQRGVYIIKYWLSRREVEKRKKQMIRAGAKNIFITMR